jgi:hypothetical protein
MNPLQRFISEDQSKSVGGAGGDDPSLKEYEAPVAVLVLSEL